MERGSRKRSSSAGSEKMERVGDRYQWRTEGVGGFTPPKFRNFDKVPKIKKILLYEMKFLVPNYSWLQNP
jgi:ribosomal protein L44E